MPICTGGSDGKASAYNAGDLGSIPGLERSPGEGNGNPLQYSCLENPMYGEAWWATVHGVAKSRTRLSDFTFFSLSRLRLRMKGSDLSLRSSHKKNWNVIFINEIDKKWQNHHELYSWLLAVILKLFQPVPNWNGFIIHYIKSYRYFICYNWAYLNTDFFYFHIFLLFP